MNLMLHKLESQFIYANPIQREKMTEANLQPSWLSYQSHKQVYCLHSLAKSVHIPYTRVNKYVRLFPKTARKYALNTQYALNNERQKIDHTPKTATPLWQHVYMKEYSAGKKNPKALRVDLVFTVESPKSVSCDAMTNIGSCLDENS